MPLALKSFFEKCRMLYFSFLYFATRSEILSSEVNFPAFKNLLYVSKHNAKARHSLSSQENPKPVNSSKTSLKHPD